MKKPSIPPKKILEFYTFAEKLKSTLRHSWLSDKNRQESVAEHSWMMGLLALLMLPQIEQELDQKKVLTMIIVHDLAEAVTQDLPVWEGSKDRAAKVAEERAAIQQMFAGTGEIGQKLLEVWEEYEQRESPEAKFVKALDTFDVVVQHNCASLETWDDNDFLWQLSLLQDDFFNVDPSLRTIKDAIDEWSIEKVAKANKLDKLDQAELAKRST